MLDLVIRGGQVVTPQGAGQWDIGVQGERIAAIGAPGSLPAEGRVDRRDRARSSCPAASSRTRTSRTSSACSPTSSSTRSGPRKTRAAWSSAARRRTSTSASSGRTSSTSAPPSSSARRAGRATRTTTTRSTSRCRASCRSATFDQIPEAIQQGFPSFKVFTVNVLPEHPKRPPYRLDFGRIGHVMQLVRDNGGLMVVHAEDEDLVQFNYEKFREDKRMEGANLPYVHTKLSEKLAFRRTITLAEATGRRRVLRPHLRAGRRRRRARGARERPADLRGDAGRRPATRRRSAARSSRRRCRTSWVEQQRLQRRLEDRRLVSVADRQRDPADAGDAS